MDLALSTDTFEGYKAEVMKTFTKVAMRVEAMEAEKEEVSHRHKKRGIPNLYKAMPGVKQAAAMMAQAYMERTLHEAKDTMSKGGDHSKQRRQQTEKAQLLIAETVAYCVRVHKFAGGCTVKGLATYKELNAYLQSLSAPGSSKEAACPPVSVLVDGGGGSPR
eukprot:jgi/Mesvir1/24776/Mv22031-RA.1